MPGFYVYSHLHHLEFQASPRCVLQFLLSPNRHRLSVSGQILVAAVVAMDHTLKPVVV